MKAFCNEQFIECYNTDNATRSKRLRPLEWGEKKDRGDQKNVVGWDNFGEMITCKTTKKGGL